MTSRRQFVQGAAGLGLLAGCGRLPGQAQQARVFRIGYLSGASASSDTVLLAAFIQGLHERGWVEGQNVRLEPRYSDGRDDPLPGLAAELVSLPIDVLLTTGVPATRAAKQATSTLPIVMASSTDPVGTGLVSSLARPGANVTGLSSASAQLAAKRLQLLKEAAPSISRVAVIRGPEFIDREREALAAVAAALALELHILLVRGADELDGYFELAIREHGDGLLVFENPVLRTRRGRVAELALQSRLPTISTSREMAAAGLLMAYAPSRADLYRRAAAYVDKVLRGTSPADLPVEQPREFEFVINLKTAQALGLTIPPHVLLQATEVIQ